MRSGTLSNELYVMLGIVLAVFLLLATKVRKITTTFILILLVIFAILGAYHEGWIEWNVLDNLFGGNNVDH